jgi:hypothetical protein
VHFDYVVWNTPYKRLRHDPALLPADRRDLSSEFREWWAEYPIRDFRPTTIEIDHPEIGRLVLEMFQLRPVEHSDMLMVLQVPGSMDDLRRVASLLGDS